MEKLPQFIVKTYPYFLYLLIFISELKDLNFENNLGRFSQESQRIRVSLIYGSDGTQYQRF